ncbi:MAG TPA: hypothetical protein VF571_09610 [Pyrinomonadaceae bacterium]|jgi:hypothetical protein
MKKTSIYLFLFLAFIFCHDTTKAQNACTSHTVCITDYADLSTALTSIGSNESVLGISVQTNVTSNTTIPANIRLKMYGNGYFNISSGVTLTIESGAGLDAIPDKHIFQGAGAVRFTKSVPASVYPEWFGAKGGDVNDDRAAILSAVASLGTASEQRGGKIKFLSRDYRFSTTLDLSRTENLTFEGVESQWNGGFVTLNYTGTASPGISLASSAGVTFRHIRISHNNYSFSGDLVKAGVVAGDHDTIHLKFDSCAFVSYAPVTGTVPRSLLNFDIAIVSQVRDSNFIGGDVNLIGRETGYSIENLFVGNSFKGHKTAAIKSIGESWTIMNNGFQGGSQNPVAAVIRGDDAYYSQGLAFINNYFEENTAGGTVISVKVLGAQFSGNRFSRPGNQGKIIELTQSQGVSISGNRLEGHGNAVCNPTCVVYGVYGNGPGHSYGIGLTGNDFNGIIPTGGNLIFVGSLGNLGLNNQIDRFTAYGELAPSNLLGIDLGYKTYLGGVNNAAGQIAVMDAATGAPNRSLGIIAPTNNGDTPIILYTFGGSAPAERMRVSGGGLITQVPLRINGNGTSVSRLSHGTCTLASGTCAVSTANITASSRVFLTGQDNNVTGALRVSARTAGSSFTVTSSNALDSGVVAWQIVEP